MKVTIQYFAALRDQRGLSEEALETSATTCRELYRELAERHGFRLKEQHVRAAINLEYVGLDTPLRDGDTVVWIPPVAGG
ncbi:MAG: MoaD/ThiS family protein [Armatimonadetes bacterium]|nr:MoaD/ThiS family protein [Armatimonadota bacterium]